YFDAKVDSTEVYVQAQVILTITLQQAINLDNRAISELDIPDAYQEPLEQRNFQRRAAGRLWQVTELRYAVFPQKSGALEIPAISFSGRELLPGRSLLGARLGRRVSIKSEPISITVKPAPADFPGDIWLPAKSLDFSGTWSSPPGQLTVGDSTTRTLRISAEGLQGSQLPPINSFGGTSGPDGLRFYPDQETIDQREISNGLQGFRNQSEALVTSTAGSWSLPELVIPWWNTETDSLEYATLPAEQVVVQAPGLASASDGSPGLDPAPAEVDVTDSLVFWQGLAGTGWLLLLITGWLAWSRSTVPDARDRGREPPRNTQELVSLKRACAENDALAARSAVLRWAKTQGRGDSGNGLEQIAARHDPDLAGELRALDKALFSKEAGATWHGERLFKLIRKIEDRTGDDGDEVLKLYPST
ncbi:MAG: BatD family protein, partial [Cellvibrionales bacterium]